MDLDLRSPRPASSLLEESSKAYLQVCPIGKLISDDSAFIKPEMDRVIDILLSSDREDFLAKIDQIAQRAIALRKEEKNVALTSENLKRIEQTIWKNCRIIELIAIGKTSSSKKIVDDKTDVQLTNLLAKLICEPSLFMTESFRKLIDQLSWDNLESLITCTKDTELDLKSSDLASLEQNFEFSPKGLSPLARYRNGEIMRVHILERMKILQALSDLS